MPEASVHMYEKGEIGGRLKTIDIAGRNYECGGSIIHPKNLLMKKLVEEMGLSPTDGSDHRPDSRFTLIDANGVLFQQSSWSFLQPLQFIYRYGIFSMLKLNYFIQGMLNDFSNIYAFLDEGLELDTTRVESLLPFYAWIFRAEGCTQCF